MIEKSIYDVRVVRHGPAEPTKRIIIDKTPVDADMKPISPTEWFMAIDEECAKWFVRELLKAVKKLEEEKENHPVCAKIAHTR